MLVMFKSHSFNITSVFSNRYNKTQIDKISKVYNSLDKFKQSIGGGIYKHYPLVLLDTPHNQLNCRIGLNRFIKNDIEDILS